MQFRGTHLTPVSARPAAAQTAQQLKFETLLSYLTNGATRIDSMFTIVSSVAGLFNQSVGAIPYKGFFGGGSSGDDGGTGSGGGIL